MDDLERLLSAMNHDLGGYLRKIEGFATLVDDPDAPAIVQDEAAAAAGWLSAVLAFHRCKVDLTRAADTPVAALVQSAWSAATARGAPPAQLRMEGDAVARMDAESMRTAFIEILHNAQRFTKDHATVTVTIDDGGPIRIIVQDDGLGFPIARADEVLEPYKKQHARSRFPGPGLGLTLADRAIRAHGGTLTLEPERGVGTRLTVTLPSHHA